jgi:hypothetical protein
MKPLDRPFAVSDSSGDIAGTGAAPDFRRAMGAYRGRAGDCRDHHTDLEIRTLIEQLRAGLWKRS